MRNKSVEIDQDAVRCVEGTAGGATYFVLMPDTGKEVALCMRQIPGRNHAGDLCMQLAGFDTWHQGTGACSKHDKTKDKPGNAPKEREHSYGNRLKTAINEYLTKDKTSLMDLTKELAATRAIMDYMLENFDPDDVENFKFDVWLRHFTGTIGALSNLVERISRVDNRNALTAAEVLFIKATMVDLFMKYIPDPTAREQAAKELASRIGGDVDAKIYPNEIKRLGA
jgi:hypothetical protein